MVKNHNCFIRLGSICFVSTFTTSRQQTSGYLVATIEMSNNHHRHRHHHHQQNGDEADAVFMCLCLLVSSTFFQLSLYHIESLPYLSASAASAALKSVKKKRGQRQRGETEGRGREQRQLGAKGAAQANVFEFLSLSFVLSPHIFFLFQLQWKCWSSTPSPGSTLEPT